MLIIITNDIILFNTQLREENIHPNINANPIVNDIKSIILNGNDLRYINVFISFSIDNLNIS